MTEQRAIETSTSDLMQKLLLEVQRFDRMTADDIGINATDLLCLVWVERAEQPVSAKALSGFLGISTGSTTALIDRLEKRKLLKRARHPTDRRGITLQPGPAVARGAAAPTGTDGHARRHGAGGRRGPGVDDGGLDVAAWAP